MVERLLQRIDAIGDADGRALPRGDRRLRDGRRRAARRRARPSRSTTPSSLLANMRRWERSLSPEELERSATAAARRVHQGHPARGVPARVPAVEPDLLGAGPRRGAHRPAGGAGGGAAHRRGCSMTHVDTGLLRRARSPTSTRCRACGATSEILRRDLLELLLAGDDPEAARRHAASLAIDLADDYAVVVAARPPASPADDSLPATLRERQRAARHRRRRPARGSAGRGGPALVGLRHGEVVALCPAAGREEHAQVRRRCEALAEALAGSGVAVGLGGWHAGLAGVGRGLRRGARGGARGRPRRARDGGRLRRRRWWRTCCARARTPTACSASCSRPCPAYDAERGTELVATLRAYVAVGLQPDPQRPAAHRAPEHRPLPPPAHPRAHRPRPAGARRPRAARAGAARTSTAADAGSCVCGMPQTAGPRSPRMRACRCGRGRTSRCWTGRGRELA